MSERERTVQRAELVDPAERARAWIATVRERGFKDGGQRFSDGQIWQAILDTQRDPDWVGNYWDLAAAKLLEHVIEHRTPPAAIYIAEALRDA